MSSETWLITGGSGMIGSNIIKQVLAKGHNCVSFDNHSAYPFDSVKEFGISNLDNLKFIKGDITDKEAISKSLKGVDRVVHGAAYADVAGCVENYDIDFKVNVVGTQNILESCLESNIKHFTFISSAAVYGNPKAGNEAIFSEGQVCVPVSTYGNSKLWGEQQTRIFSDLYGLPSSSTRLFSVYGPPQVPKLGSHSWCVAIFAMQALKDLPLTINGNGEQVRDFTHVSEIAEGIIRTTEADTTIGKTINIGTGKSTTINEIAHAIKERFDNVKLVYQPLPKGDPLGAHADVQLMEELLDWRPTMTIEDGVNDYLDWVLANRHLIPDWL